MTRYSAEELFRMAEAVERDGMSFYRQAAAVVSDPELAGLLNELASWEGKHHERFATMRAELPPEARRGIGPGNPVEEHAADYLQAWVDGKVFPGSLQPGGELPPLTVPEDVLDYALTREKETIVFFLTLQAQVPTYCGQDRIRDIIDEELNHVYILERMRRERPGLLAAREGQG